MTDITPEPKPQPSDWECECGGEVMELDGVPICMNPNHKGNFDQPVKRWLESLH